MFDCCCAGVPADLGAFKISYADMHARPQKCMETRAKLYECPPTHTHTHTHTRANKCTCQPFAFQKSKIAQGGGRGSMASGFPKSACEVNES